MRHNIATHAHHPCDPICASNLTSPPLQPCGAGRLHVDAHTLLSDLHELGEILLLLQADAEPSQAEVPHSAAPPIAHHTAAPLSLHAYGGSGTAAVRIRIRPPPRPVRRSLANLILPLSSESSGLSRNRPTFLRSAHLPAAPFLQFI
jgi:hypothetical protein